MPLVTIATKALSPFAVDVGVPTFTAADAANDHKFVNDGRKVLLVNNESASPITITIPGNTNSQTFQQDPGLAIAVAANTIHAIGPFAPNVYNQTGSVVHVMISDDTTLSFAVLSVPEIAKG